MQNGHADASKTVSCLKPPIRRVLIVGAGIAGLSAAHALQKQGIPFDVIDAQADVSGVWASGYEGLRAQGPWFMMAHPEFPMPDGARRFGAYEYPSGKALCEYLRSLAEHFDLRQHIRCNTRLVRLERRSTGDIGWRAICEDTRGGSSCAGQPITYDADFVIMSTGNFSRPSLPATYKDMERFRGKIIPARMLYDKTVLKDQRVLVLGGGKTSQDMGMAAVDAGASKVVNLLRRAHWAVPERIMGVLPYIYISHTRLAAFLLPKFYSTRALPRGLEAVKNWAWHSWWAVAAFACKVTLGMEGPLLPTPEQEPLADQYVGGLAGNRRFYNMANEGRIQPIIGDVDRFTADSVITKDGTEIGPFDVVVAATGYERTYDYLPAKEKAALGLREDGLWLFRCMLPPRVPGLAFVGSNVVTFSDWLVSGCQSEWLARAMAGKMLLPGVEDQEADVEAHRVWKCTFAPPGNNRAANLMLHMTDYIEQLISDMGLSTRHRGWNIFAENFLPLQPHHYRHVFEAATLEQQGKVNSPPLRTIPVHRVSASEAASCAVQKIDMPYGGIPVKDTGCANVLVTGGLAAV